MSEIKIGLAGNPNCGKTTLFNALTGASQYVGNWPGVTVEKKEGKIKGNSDVTLVDLPGVYSLSPYTQEEVVARNFLVGERPDVILNIIDGTNIERNLYLTTQLAELGIPMIIAINMMDLVRKNGDEIDIKKLGKEFNCQVVEISALKGTGIGEVAGLAVSLANSGVVPKIRHNFSGSVEHALAHIEEACLHELPEEQQRWYAVKIFERDRYILDEFKLPDNIRKHIEFDIVACEQEKDDDAESIITNDRYNYITKLAEQCFTRKNINRIKISDKIDRVVTNRFLALPIFAIIMIGVYFVSVTSVGGWCQQFITEVLFNDWICGFFAQWLPSIGCATWLTSLIVDGIISGVGAVIGFAPQMAILFLFLSFLEDCGYMSRIAFLMDSVFRKFGLSGKSVIPLLIGTGCGVPGIMASKTIESDNDRRMTIITTTFIPCGAKLPVIALIGSSIMGGAWWMAPLMYLIGVLAVLMSSIMLKKTRPFSYEDAPFVMELPNYHLSAVSGVLLHMWERVRGFLKKAGTVIVIASAIMWFISTFGIENGQFIQVSNADNSLIAYLARCISWAFSPLGWSNWQTVSAMLSGFFAKENIVSTIAVLSGVSQNGTEINTSVQIWLPSMVAGLSFLIFNLLNSPCVAAISAMAKEMKDTKWFIFGLLYQNVFAYCVCLVVYQLVGLITGTVALNLFTIVAIILVALALYQIVKPDPYKNKKRPLRAVSR